MTVSDWVSLLILAALAVAVLLGRRKGQQMRAAALAAARAEGKAEAKAELQAQLINHVTVTASGGVSEEVRAAELRILREAVRAVSGGPVLLEDGPGFERLLADVTAGQLPERGYARPRELDQVERAETQGQVRE